MHLRAPRMAAEHGLRSPCQATMLCTMCAASAMPARLALASRSTRPIERVRSCVRAAEQACESQVCCAGACAGGWSHAACVCASAMIQARRIKQSDQTCTCTILWPAPCMSKARHMMSFRLGNMHAISSNVQPSMTHARELCSTLPFCKCFSKSSQKPLFTGLITMCIYTGDLSCTIMKRPR